ncbi:uncharacterized protein A1O5_11925 [Cladophialophora psammophila CBS 110553]|uniref:ENTH domain-containing protein n=1 Tax=Cladophialophora psammophila CBS 110553 TaxID=1182543 RepID=W9VZY1_9EURO|nr:uncharacterized protein A1O5_11925 [Cladophialophora psammophila CBS 110553]EXJ61367.1 hypothetical protein A1O5_11925 [Cladophialophora psammophila CBS 110553]
MEKIVKGATKIKLAAPKSKYIEPILSATHGGESGAAEVFRTLQLRLRDSTWTIVFKALIVVHLMIREGQPEVTLRYISESPKRLAISSFTEGQTQGLNIRRYSEYLLERVRAFRDTKTDFVKSGAGKMRRLTVEKGLLRQTEIVQDQIEALVRCDLLGTHDPDNEISLTAFRLLTLDLLELFKVMNEGTINVLEHYFEMSRPDAERALQIYKTFGRQTEMVVQYLSLARQYEMSTRLEVPRLKHAPTTLTNALEEYLNDPDFELNRRQYLAQQEAKRTGKPVSAAPSSNPFDKPATKEAAATSSVAKPQPLQSPPKGPAPDLIDFFESIEQNQQTMGQANFNPQPQFQQGTPQAQSYQQAPVPLQMGYNPFLQQQQTFQSQALPQAQTQPLQTDFTGAGFGGYGAQPQQQVPPAGGFQFSTQLSPIPQNGVANFQSQSFPSAPLSPIQPQQTSTNPFRQSTMNTGSTPFSPVSPPAPARSSTNPFAKHNTGAIPNHDHTAGTMHDQTTLSPISPEQPFPSNPSFLSSPPPLQPQRTGTNPFAKNRPTTSGGPVTTNVTGSTNPFRQSAFVNQQTGQGWQHSNQGTLLGFDVNNVDTVPVFPRPGHG